MSTGKIFFQRKFVFVTTLLLTILVSMLGVAQKNVYAAALPCDIYASAGTPCVAAHSTTRALFSAYSGRLYQVKRASNGATTDIGTLTAGGYANAATQDSFCAGTTCTITIIYDQSSQHNDLPTSIAGGQGGADAPANANALPMSAGGVKVYGVYVAVGVGYRDVHATGTAKNGQAEGMYMVTSGTHVNNGCCFDYGNTEQPLANDTGNGHMDAVYFGLRCEHAPCSGSGPWIAADLENGLFQGNGSNTGDQTVNFNFVTAMLKNNGQTTFALKTGNANSGGLTTQYNGTLPNNGFSGYIPMKQEGGIVLGVGGDNSKASAGSFFEGVMTSGYPTDAAENSVQANIVSVGYSTNVGPTATPSGPTATPGGPTATPNPSPQPVAFYAFENNANDSSGNARNGTLFNSPTFVAGHIGQAINLNGTNQYVQIPRSIQDSFTIAFWVKTTQTGGTGTHWWSGRGLVDGEVANVANDFGVSLVGAQAAFGVGNPDTTIKSTSNINNGAWHRVAVTRNSTTGVMILYFDGVQQSSVTGPTGTKNAPANLRIGSLQTNINFFAGQIDEVRLYSTVLSAAQVAALP